MGFRDGSSKGHGEGVAASGSSVREVGFNDGTSYPLCNNENNAMVESEKTVESTSNSKLDTVSSNEEEKVDRSRSGTEEEMFQAMWIERNCINGDSRDKESSKGKIKLSDLVGESSRKHWRWTVWKVENVNLEEWRSRQRVKREMRLIMLFRFKVN
ncbi:hypothetical protein V6N11_036126 [Hibiscus sabdariffa]|uniref:Uncharacterized protein n=1 Tax=Hibiscus sabdariffa TaxID=183260 RepID=A0ABR2R9F5_9ROSI